MIDWGDHREEEEEEDEEVSTSHLSHGRESLQQAKPNIYVKMLKIQMLEQIVTNENVIDDADDQRHSGGAGRGAGALSPGGPLADGSSRPGSANLSPIASKSSSTSGGAGADDETRSLNRSSRLSPQG